MNKYEGVFVFNAGYASEQMQSAIDSVTDTITKEGGNITVNEDWGNRRLAYPIKKVVEGRYLFLRFELAPEKIERINGLYRLNDKVMRSLIVREDEKITPPKVRKPREEEEGSAASEDSSAPAAEAAAPAEAAAGEATEATQA